MRVAVSKMVCVSNFNCSSWHLARWEQLKVLPREDRPLHSIPMPRPECQGSGSHSVTSCDARDKYLVLRLGYTLDIQLK